MSKYCAICGRPAHKGLCDMVELDTGKVVHASRVYDPDGDIHKLVDEGKVKVVQRWRKKYNPKPVKK